MLESTRIKLKEYKDQFKNYESYIKSTDWTADAIDVEGSYTTEASLADSILSNLKSFIKEQEEDINLKEVLSFFKYSLKILDIHTGRINTYLTQNDWKQIFDDEKSDRMSYLKQLREDYEETEETDEGLEEEIRHVEKLIKNIEKRRKEEINFQKSLFDQKTKVSLSISTLNIASDNRKSTFENLFFAKKRAPLIMKDYLCGIVPTVKEQVDKIDINWESPSYSTSPEMFINMKPKDIPPYDPNKHFFEQSTDVLQFWNEEVYKLKNGININGYHISNWLYWIKNFFYINQGTQQNKDVTTASIRDNEFFFDHMWTKARQEYWEAMLMYGTRRGGKTSIMSSKMLLDMMVIPRCQGQLVATNSEDLGQLLGYMATAIEHLPPALAFNVNVNSDKEFKIGLKKNAQTPYDMSVYNILNLDAGKKKGTQKLAGGTPDSVAIDEIGKGAVKKSYLALRPALQKGRRTTVLMAGTGNGEEDLSADAEDMLRNYETFGIMPMDWDKLEQISDPEYITWKRTNFSMFVPAQMNLMVDKISTNFKDFLKSDNEDLAKIPIEVTDWKNATEFFLKEREKVAADHVALTSEIIFHPLETEEVFISNKVNPFNSIGIKEHREKLIKKELTGTKVRFYVTDDGIISKKIVNDPIIDVYPFKGGNVDAPIQLYEVIDEVPPFGMYVIGLDDIKHDTSDGDSVLSTTVYKRGIELDEWADRVVAKYDTRPYKKEDAYQQLYYLMKYYNAIVFPENEDNGFVDFLERKYAMDAYKHIASSVDFAMAMGFDHNRNRKIGYAPTGRNNRHLNNRVIAYTKEDVPVQNADGDDIMLEGYVRFNDIMLCSEMISYKAGANADRIRSFGLALIYAEYLDKNHMHISRRKYRDQEDEKPKPKVTMNRGFGGRKKMKKW